jgi:hypothetical protein
MAYLRLGAVAELRFAGLEPDDLARREIIRSRGTETFDWSTSGHQTGLRHVPSLVAHFASCGEVQSGPRIREKA